MKITHISIDGVKGRRAGIDLQQKHLLLTGDMGSGKSAMIDGLHLALNLPTRYGTTNLDRLSPSGEWSVLVEFDHPRVRRLQRVMRRTRTFLEVNGMKVDRAEYEKAVREVIDVEPHHVSLNEFLQLSGAKRAALFAQMLEPADVYTLDQALNTIDKCDATTFFTRALGEGQMPHIRDTLAKLSVLSGTPTELTNAVKSIANDATASERDAKTRLEGLQAKQVAVSHGMTREELKQRLQKLDEDLGGLKSRKENLLHERERYDAALKVLSDTEKALGGDRQRLQELHAKAAALDDAQRRVSADEQALLRVKEAKVSAEQNVDAAKRKARDLADDRQKMSRSLNLLNDLLEQPWTVDQEWLVEELVGFLEKIQVHIEIEHVRQLPPATSKQIQETTMEFAKEVVAEVLGGDVEKLKQQIGVLDARIAEADADVAGMARVLGDAVASMQQAEKALEESRKALDDAQEAANEIPTVEARIAQLDQSRAGLEQNVQRSAVSEDETALDGQIASLTAQRTTLSKQLRELEDAQSISGQVEDARVEVARWGTLKLALVRLSDLVQRWRDDMVRARLAAVMDPFRQCFETIFDCDMGLDHQSRGEGRSTEFYFTINRRGVPVEFDLLSEGETVLTAAAFLTALQRIKSGPGTFLSLNAGELPLEGLRRLLRSVPKLGLDCVIVANNNATLLNLDDDQFSDWDIVNMENPPPPRR